MQTANIVLHIGGDSGTTVPKYAIPASEIAVLQTIHGPGSVSEIDPTEDVERTSREEIKRLAEIYGRATVQDDNGSKVSVMSSLFPGAAARAFQTIDELEIGESFFKPTERAKPAAPKAKRAKKADADDAPADDQADDDAADDVADDDDDDQPETDDGKLFD